MMGEYVLYYGGKVVGGIYDNRLLVKIIEGKKNKICKNLYLMMVQNICI